MRRKEYLKKKFEYYEYMKEWRTKEHKILMKKLELEHLILMRRYILNTTPIPKENKKEELKNEDTEWRERTIEGVSW